MNRQSTWRIKKRFQDGMSNEILTDMTSFQTLFDVCDQVNRM